MTEKQEKVATLILPPEFAQLLESIYKQHGIQTNVFNQPCLALDPGETTGWAMFDGDARIIMSQEPTKTVTAGYNWLRERLQTVELVHIRCEDYRVYEWKTGDHAWSPIHTLRFIGAIEVAAYEESIPLSFCMAQHAKAWWTDAKLKHFGLYVPGLRHGRDALRHLLYYLCFPTKANG